MTGQCHDSDLHRRNSTTHYPNGDLLSEISIWHYQMTLPPEQSHDVIYISDKPVEMAVAGLADFLLVNRTGSVGLTDAGADAVASLELGDASVVTVSSTAHSNDGNTRLSGIIRGRQVQIVVDDVPVPAFEGESVAACLLAAGRRGLRVTPRKGEQRGMYCGIGVCFDCVMTFDGQRTARACLTPVRDGLRVETKRGNDMWLAVTGGDAQ
jgi:hypothetical protein